MRQREFPRHRIIIKIKELIDRNTDGDGRNWQARQLDGVTGPVAFVADCGIGSRVGFSRAAVPLARSVLGTDHDASDYAVVVGRSAYGFLPTVCGGSTWSRSWRDNGELFRAARSRIRI